MNTEDLGYLYSIAIQEEITKKYESFFAILYVGVLGPHRGIETAIEAMPQILQTIPNAKLLLVGSGSNEVKLKQLASKRQLDEVVEFTGWQDFDLVPSYIAASNICLHTFIDTTLLQSRASSANKVFHYMAMGKPTIVASSQEAMSRLVHAADAGIEYSAGDPHSLALAIVKLYRDKDLVNKLGEAGRKAVREKYNWNVEGAKLVSLYRDLSL
ncbi:MAG: glycosyltransferase [Chloroflexi bacterium]|nr:glycosyltransferase [Chloroflexota bacterium]